MDIHLNALNRPWLCCNVDIILKGSELLSLIPVHKMVVIIKVKEIASRSVPKESCPYNLLWERTSRRQLTKMMDTDSNSD